MSDHQLLAIIAGSVATLVALRILDLINAVVAAVMRQLMRRRINMRMQQLAERFATWVERASAGPDEGAEGGPRVH